MVYLQFPPDLTEEELRLKEMYIKLKKKKKALQDLKTRSTESQRVQQLTKPKCPIIAREVAKKLIKSGVIAPIKTPKPPEQSFKRPLGFERNINNTEKRVLFYQPYSETKPAKEKLARKRQKKKKLSDSFVSSTDPADKVVKKPVLKPKDKPIKRNTIFVYGIELSEGFLREHFATFGNIVKIVMKGLKMGFVIFENPESAEEAISQMDGKKISWVKLQVSMARKQFEVRNQLDDSSASSNSVPSNSSRVEEDSSDSD